MERAPKTKWPHGLPTATCEGCGGTGAIAGELHRAARSRDLPPETKEEMARRIKDLACRDCEGRGRVLVNQPTTEKKGGVTSGPS